MEKLYLNWQLWQQEEQLVQRYCHNCGTLVAFYDSGKIRRNANGKNIYEFAIYKCEQGHTWNRKVEVMKAPLYMDKIQEKKDIKEMKDKKENGSIKVDELYFKSYIGSPIKEICIMLESVQGKWRLDKLLAKQLVDLSRNEVKGLIENGQVLLEGRKTKGGVFVKENQQVTILLNN